MKLAIFLLFFSFTINALDQKPLVVIYPAPQSEKDTRRPEVKELIKLALEATKDTHGPYILKKSSQYMNIKRQERELKNSKNINIAWFDTTEEKNNKLLPIEIPMQMGIVGYRVLLVQEKFKKKFEKVSNIEDLRKLKNGLMKSWNNYDIFNYNNLPIALGNNYEGLFLKLRNGHFDYFSRGLNEAYKELQDRPSLQKDLVVDKNISLYYKHYNFLYTSKKNIALNERIKKGLKLIIKNGIFYKVFCKFNRKYIEQSNLSNRTLIELYNPIIPKSLVLDKSLIFSPKNNICSTKK
ncbi:hypothetical protein A9Q84_15440 [Halobacteriovorax marinus]|uniref:Solute-binding protein family 3/N-terminal domain-containing protein n=1 Tax=Halobacteriovorax marinus TaxID=97084 RepID=A0A1Y5F438_9BACT|nr:hypothetical protein A9Q84_15440 [Halobacteriovorax marinus]